MFLKTGLFSIALLLASRLLGLLRESALAAAFGTSGMGDVAVLMLTLPDWMTGVLVSGALAYVLLPHWAGQNPIQRAYSQRRVAHRLMVSGVLAGLLLCLFRVPVSVLLASGVPPHLLPQAAQALVWSAFALPAALLAALWVTRLQFEKDFTGLYAANLLVNVVLIIALLIIADNTITASPLTLLGLCFGLAMCLRLLWLRWRLDPFTSANDTTTHELRTALPRAPLWLWAALSAGVPMTLPFVARSFASGAGEGALVTFNCAWKLVELPLVLAIQWVATLAFPSISQTMRPRQGTDADRRIGTVPVMSMEAIASVRAAFLVAWTLACACVAALQVGAFGIADWLFGWGRMSPEGLATIADWGATGAWGLLPQALIAVALMVLATLGRMRPVVLAYSAALVAMLVVGVWSHGAGSQLMVVLNSVACCVAIIALLQLPRHGAGLLPWQAMIMPLVLLLLCTWLAHGGWMVFLEQKSLLALMGTASVSMIVIALSCFASRELRTAFRQ